MCVSHPLPCTDPLTWRQSAPSMTWMWSDGKCKYIVRARIAPITLSLYKPQDFHNCRRAQALWYSIHEIDGNCRIDLCNYWYQGFVVLQPCGTRFMSKVKRKLIGLFDGDCCSGSVSCKLLRLWSVAIVGCRTSTGSLCAWPNTDDRLCTSPGVTFRNVLKERLVKSP